MPDVSMTKNDVLVVKWVDNKCMTIRTNYDKVQLTCNVQRWNKGT